MRASAALALLALLILPSGCKFPGRGAKVRDVPDTTGTPDAPKPPTNPPDVASRPTVPKKPPPEDKCGPQPTPKVVERLVLREHPDRAARDFHFSKLERWCVTHGKKIIWGWRLVVAIDEEPKPGQEKIARGAYLIRKQPEGFAIVARGETKRRQSDFAWSLREPEEPDRKLARQQELERRRAQWARARRVPTAEELVSADFGSAPSRYRRTIQNFLHDKRGVSESANVKLQQPVKTWARHVGSADTVFGWRVTATVVAGPDSADKTPQSHHFMFRDDDLISTTRLGKGFLLGSAQPPEPPEPAEPPKPSR